MGPAEIGVIIVVALLVFGPDKLPELARQAGSFVKTVRRMADSAKDDLGREIGQDLKNVNLRDLDPREAVRRAMFDDDTKPVGIKETRILRPGERPPFDPEST